MEFIIKHNKSSNEKNIHNSKPAFGSSKEFVIQSNDKFPILLNELHNPLDSNQVLELMYGNLSKHHSNSIHNKNKINTIGIIENINNNNKSNDKSNNNYNDTSNVLHLKNHVYAAVALILRPRDNTLDALLVKRAESDWDVFAGESCLPGGLYQSSDSSLFETVTREVKEELSLDLLSSCKFIGQVPISDRMKVKMNHVTVCSIVFVFEYIEGEIIPDDQEICAAAWVDCAIFWRKKHEFMKKIYVPIENIVSENALKEKASSLQLTLIAPNVIFSSFENIKLRSEKINNKSNENLYSNHINNDNSNKSNHNYNETTQQISQKEWLVWGLTLQLISTSFFFGASIPPLFPYYIESSDNDVKQILQYNWELSKAFIEAAWNSNKDSTASMVCNGLVHEILRLKERRCKI